jgi:hypothetical protein
MQALVPSGVAGNAGVHHAESDSDRIWEFSRWGSFADGSDRSKQWNED